MDPRTALTAFDRYLADRGLTLEAVVVGGAEVTAAGGKLKEDWLNNGPSALAPLLPAGWELRLQEAFRGRVLILRSLHRSDLLKSKLFALCDRALDLPDCIALAPTPAELAEATTWLEPQDLNPHWPEHVRATLGDLAKRLGHGT
jgi:hypothetical protein